MTTSQVFRVSLFRVVLYISKTLPARLILMEVLLSKTTLEFQGLFLLFEVVSVINKE
jgi:hypothetical protein